MDSIERRHVYKLQIRLSFRPRETELGLAWVALAELYSTVHYEGFGRKVHSGRRESFMPREPVPRGRKEDSLE
jgi:hypothetical protein